MRWCEGREVVWGKGSGVRGVKWCGGKGSGVKGVKWCEGSEVV